jgi:hypothetical protein
MGRWPFVPDLITYMLRSILPIYVTQMHGIQNLSDLSWPHADIQFCAK